MARKIKKCPVCNGYGLEPASGEFCELCDGTGNMITYDAKDIVPLEYMDTDPDAEPDQRDFDNHKSAFNEDDDI